MDDQSLEKELAEKAKAPRVTLEKMNDEIVAENIFNLGDALRAIGHPAPADADLTTICALTTKLGFVLIGTSACVSRENYSAEIGARIARQKAFDQLWPLEGYRLKAELSKYDSANGQI